MILTREQLEDRLAALHQASLELVKDFSLDSLLEHIASLACEQVDARYAAIGVLGEDGSLERFIPIGMLPEEIQEMDHLPHGQGLIGALMNTRDPIRIADMKDHPKSTGLPTNHPPMRSFLGVPIRLGERQLGQIYLTNKTTALGFSDDDQMIIENLAAYAAVAISNARVYQELAVRDEALMQRNQDLALLNELAVTLASASSLDEIFDKALTRLVEYLHVEAGEIYLTEENGKNLHLALRHSKGADTLWIKKVFPVGDGLIGMTVKTGLPRFMTIPESTDPYLYKSVFDSTLHQIACFPLTARSGVMGVLCVATNQARSLDEREIQFLNAMSAWIATSADNVKLNLQGRRLAVLEERERIGMDLHDGIIQSIYAVGLTLEHARLLMEENIPQARLRIDQAMSDLNATIRDIRAYILDLRPRQLHEENLMDGLQRLVNEFRVSTPIEVNLKGPVDGIPFIQDLQAIALFHICQEALANVAKHSHAKQVDVYLWTTSNRALLEIEDDGRGFNQQKTATNIGHGLSNMVTRARNVGGDVEITSEQGVGTTILAWVPFSDNRSHVDD